jgi:hypothetical protein
VERFAEEFGKLWRAAGGSEVGLLAVIVVLALVLLGMRLAGAITWPKMPEPSPDLVENPPSPPITLNPDGSIPTANPVTPPEPLP